MLWLEEWVNVRPEKIGGGNGEQEEVLYRKKKVSSASLS
jgi:hypothetical protein